MSTPRSSDRRGHGALWAALCLSAAAGCLGQIGDGGPEGSPSPDAGEAGTSQGNSLDAPTSFQCDTTVKPAAEQLRALTTGQYVNTLSDLVSYAVGSGAAGPALMGTNAVVSALALLPPNTPTIPLPMVNATASSAANSVHLATAFPDGGWLRTDQSIQQSRIAAFYAVGVAIAQQLTTPALLGKVVGTCALGNSGASDAACLAAFIQSFGSRALRRPVTTADVTLFESMYTLNGPDPTNANPAAAAYADVITGILNAPEFLYFVEHGGTPVANLPGVYQLDAYELAARLSYQVWDTLPDSQLWAVACDGTLLQPAVYQNQVDRMFADPRAKAAMNRFFADYFQVENLGGQHGTGGLNYHNLADPNTLSSPLFQAFAGSDLPTPALGPDMLADALGMVDYYTWTKPGTVHDLLTSGLSFAQTPDVAKVYGLPVWNGTSAPPSFPANQRPGLFTRALFVAAGIDSSPILKGVFLRRYLLCDTLGPPPAAAANKSVPLTTTETTRQATTALTGQAPCNGCHTDWINPLGFATEGFDGLGRHRTQQTLYNADGTVAAKLPVDTAVTPYVEMADGTTTASDAADVMNLIETSNKPAACLARNYFRYTFARFEDVTQDACALESVRQAAQNGGHLLDVWKAIVTTPAFKQRAFQ